MRLTEQTPARHDLFWACRCRSSGVEIDPQPRIRIPEMQPTAATATTSLMPGSLQMASIPPAAVRTVDAVRATIRRAIVLTEAAATAVVRMVPVRVVCVPAVNVRHVLTVSVADAQTASGATDRTQTETAQADSARSIRIRMLATTPVEAMLHRETGRLAQRDRILQIRFAEWNLTKTITGLSVLPCEIL